MWPLDPSRNRKIYHLRREHERAHHAHERDARWFEIFPQPARAVPEQPRACGYHNSAHCGGDECVGHVHIFSLPLANRIGLAFRAAFRPAGRYRPRNSATSDFTAPSVPSGARTGGDRHYAPAARFADGAGSPPVDAAYAEPRQGWVRLRDFAHEPEPDGSRPGLGAGGVKRPHREVVENAGHRVGRGRLLFGMGREPERAVFAYFAAGVFGRAVVLPDVQPRIGDNRAYLGGEPNVVVYYKEHVGALFKERKQVESDVAARWGILLFCAAAVLFLRPASAICSHLENISSRAT